MKIVLNLEKTVKVRDMKHAKRVHEAFWREWSWLDDTYDSIILINSEPTGYLSPNCRFWEWDDTEDVKKNSVMSNPFTNGSICCNMWRARKHKLINVGDHYYEY